MDTLELDRLLSLCPVTKKYYKGCFPCNGLPLPATYPCSMIANTDPMHERGRHWIALFISKPNYVYYFDSLGNKPNKCLLMYLSKHFINVCYNLHSYQPQYSNFCGLYCAVFLYYMSLYNNPSFAYNKLLSTLAFYVKSNPDLYIEKFVRKYFLLMS